MYIKRIVVFKDFFLHIFLNLLNRKLTYCHLCCRKAAIAGILAGGAAQFLASPTDLVKVQMQMEGKRLMEGKVSR